MVSTFCEKEAAEKSKNPERVGMILINRVSDLSVIKFEIFIKIIKEQDHNRVISFGRKINTPTTNDINADIRTAPAA